MDVEQVAKQGQLVVHVGLRGELSRWLLELRAGVFVGKVSALVRDLLWEEVCQKSQGGSALLLDGGFRRAVVDSEAGIG